MMEDHKRAKIKWKNNPWIAHSLLAEASSLVACTAALLLCESGSAFAIIDLAESFGGKTLQRQRLGAGNNLSSSGNKLNIY